jgi:CDP-L-myo-inositol myo-inositolphosphotransferase
MESENNPEIIAAFPSAAAADRLIAGVPAAARAVRSLAEDGASSIIVRIGDRTPLAAETRAEIARLQGAVAVQVEAGTGPAVALPTSWQIVRATGKAGDGLVSRWLNRPISQRLTWLVLAMPGIRPIHVTVFNALLALPMFLLLLFGGHMGLILGAILFHAASVIDGVDGEMARATWRTSAEGASLDSLIDMSINFLFVLGLTIHLALRDHDAIGWIGVWAIVAMIVGNALIGRRVRAQGAPLGFDLFKRRNARIGGLVDLVYWVVQVISSRDFFALLFMLLTLVGLERVALCIFAGVAVIWFCYVLLASLLAVPRSYRGAA